MNWVLNPQNFLFLCLRRAFFYPLICSNTMWNFNIVAITGYYSPIKFDYLSSTNYLRKTLNKTLLQFHKK